MGLWRRMRRTGWGRCLESGTDSRISADVKQYPPRQQRPEADKRRRECFTFRNS